MMKLIFWYSLQLLEMLSPDFLLKATFLKSTLRELPGPVWSRDYSGRKSVVYLVPRALPNNRTLKWTVLRSSAFPLVFHFVELSNDGNHHPYTSNFDALLAMSKLMNAWQNSACNLHVDNCCFKEPAHFVFNALRVKPPTLSNVLSQLYRKINQARVDFADGLFAWWYSSHGEGQRENVEFEFTTWKSLKIWRSPIAWEKL